MSLISHVCDDLSTLIRDAGIAICHLRGSTISILHGPEMDWRGWPSGVHRHKEVDPKKNILSLGHQTGSRHRSGSAGIDNEAH